MKRKRKSSSEKEKKIFIGKFTTSETLPKSIEKEEENFFQIFTTVCSGRNMFIFTWWLLGNCLQIPRHKRQQPSSLFKFSIPRLQTVPPPHQRSPILTYCLRSNSPFCCSPIWKVHTPQLLRPLALPLLPQQASPRNLLFPLKYHIAQYLQ